MSNSQSIWKSTEKMLLVVSYSSLDEIKKYREALKDMGLNIHQCIILAIVPTKKEKMMLSEISSVTFCSEQEINILGKFKNELAVKTLAENYDLLTVVGDLSKKMTKVVKKAKTRVAIGVNSNVEFLTINMNSKSTSPVQILNFVKETLEKIN